MSRLKEYILHIVLLAATLLHGVAGHRINTTIYDTNLAHVTYAPKDDFCVRWQSSWVFWKTCAVWARPWRSSVYRSQGKIASLHRSLDHQLASMTIEFQGSAVWLYGPPRSQLTAIPVDYKICLHEDHRLAPDPVCYRVDVAEAYSAAEDYESPVVIFAKGALQYREHRIVISVGNPKDESRVYEGIQFSHAVYTIERSTPWPVEEDNWRFREVVMHDTHPLLSYWPRERVPPCSTGRCWSAMSGWSAKTYTAEDGSVVSWHELRSQDEWSRDNWGVDATITAGAVVVYGVPKVHITDTDYLSHICVRIDSGPCEIVDVRHAYLNADHHHESVLLWRSDALDPYRQTHVSIRLVKTSSGSTSVFPFKSIHYYEQQEYSSPDPPAGQLENVVIAHDDGAIEYHPGRRCVRHFAWWCTKWFDPWTWREAGPSESRLTYRSTVWSYRTTEDPAITMNFQGSAVYVYGAPRSWIRDPFASQHVCINDVCHIVDVEQAYLNAPQGLIESAGIHALHNNGVDTSEHDNQEDATAEHNVTALSMFHPELEPVLIWSMTGLDDKVQHTLRLALAPLHSVDNAEMSIAKVVYTKVSYEQGQSRPDTPIPQPEDTFEGPLYPPHATKWAPRGPPPPLPTPSRPPQPPQPPHGNPPSNPGNPPRSPNDPLPDSVILTYWLPITLTVLYVLSKLRCRSGNNTETQPIVRPDTPPPPYPGWRPPNPQVQPPSRSSYSHSRSSYNTFSSANDISRSGQTHTSSSHSSQSRVQPPTNTHSHRSQPSTTSFDSKRGQGQQNNYEPHLGFNVPSNSARTNSAATRAEVPPERRNAPTSSTCNASSRVRATSTYSQRSSTGSTAHSGVSDRYAPPAYQNASSPIPSYSSTFSIAPSSTRDSTSWRVFQPPPPPPPPPRRAPPPPPLAASRRTETVADDEIERRFAAFAQLVANSRAQAQQPTAAPRPNPRQVTTQDRTYHPALAQWASSQGYRIDRLMDGAGASGQGRPTRNQGARLPPGAASNFSHHPYARQGNTRIGDIAGHGARGGHNWRDRAAEYNARTRAFQD